MNPIIEKMNDGGPVFTYPILILLLVILALFIKEVLSKTQSQKTIALIASIAWLAVAWGFLGRTFGLIQAFDNIAAAGELTPSLMAGGLKMALVDPMLGIITFVIARLVIIALTLLQKQATS